MPKGKGTYGSTKGRPRKARSRAETSGPRYARDLAPGEVPTDSNERAGRKNRHGDHTWGPKAKKGVTVVKELEEGLKSQIDRLLETRRAKRETDRRPNPQATDAAKESGDPEAFGKPRYSHIPKGSTLAPRKKVPAKVKGEDYATTLRKKAEKAGKAGRRPRG